MNRFFYVCVYIYIYIAQPPSPRINFLTPPLGESRWGVNMVADFLCIGEFGGQMESIKNFDSN